MKVTYMVEVDNQEDFDTDAAATNIRKDLENMFSFVKVRGVYLVDMYPQQSGILQPWVASLGLRHQGVLVSAVRGCDSVPRDDPMKQLTRFYRTCLLQAHCGDAKHAVSFMIHIERGHDFWKIADPVLKSIDHYPSHFLLHFLHASEVMGYKMPKEKLARIWWQEFYCKLVRKMHLNPESESQMDERLNADEQTSDSLHTARQCVRLDS